MHRTEARHELIAAPVVNHHILLPYWAGYSKQIMQVSTPLLLPGMLLLAIWWGPRSYWRTWKVFLGFAFSGMHFAALFRVEHHIRPLIHAAIEYLVSLQKEATIAFLFPESTAARTIVVPLPISSPTLPSSIRTAHCVFALDQQQRLHLIRMTSKSVRRSFFLKWFMSTGVPLPKRKRR